MYKNEFEESIDRTSRLGLGDILCAYQDNLVIPKDNDKMLSDIFSSIMVMMKPKEIIAKCISAHYHLLRPLENALGSEAIYTIGYIETNGKYIYKKNESELISFMNNDYSKGGDLNVHTWITLPSMEIIDFTIGSTIALVKNLPEMHGAIFHGHADEFDDSFKYHPMLVGDGFLRKAQLIN